jgi:Arc/MetJ-type ribon-helix-helix transcriptional regulator
MSRRSFRLPELLEERIAQAIREDGYSSFAAFVRTAIQNELKRREQQADASKIEQSIAEALERQNEAQRRVVTTLQAHFRRIQARNAHCPNVERPCRNKCAQSDHAGV